MTTTKPTLQHQLDRLHQQYQLQFADHGRMTRDLALLDALVAEAETLTRAVEASDDAHLLEVAQRRLRTYVEARGTIAQVQATAGLRDVEASHLVVRSRLVLHRYVRHFSGQSRRTRDLERMRELVADLVSIGEALRPMMGQVQVPSVGDDIQAVGEFIGFFLSERKELEAAWLTGSREEQSRSLGTLVEELLAAWQAHVVPEPRHLRRPATLRRMVASLDRAVDALLGLQHANMPEEHEARVAKAARELVRWQEEQRASEEARQALSEAAVTTALDAHAQALFDAWREQTVGEPATRDLAYLRGLCDRFDDVEQQLYATWQADGDAAQRRRLAWVRDVLVAMERSYDQVVAAQLGG